MKYHSGFSFLSARPDLGVDAERGGDLANKGGGLCCFFLLGAGMAAEAGGDLRLEVASLPEAPRESMHLLPCRIHHDGKAAVQRYFDPAIRESSVSFRGRSLKGVQVSVPEGYTGLVLEKDGAPLLPSEEKQVRVKSTFESLTVWNLEQAPKSTDEILMAFHWPKIAEGIHATVTDEK